MPSTPVSLRCARTAEGLTLINNEETFKLKDGSINDGYYLHDGTHLTMAGTNRLAKNLKVNLMPGQSKDITKKPVPRYISRPQHQQPTRASHGRGQSSKSEPASSRSRSGNVSWHSTSGGQHSQPAPPSNKSRGHRHIPDQDSQQRLLPQQSPPHNNPPTGDTKSYASHDR